MSKVAIKGNASGTGTFTVEAPNSNTDRTLVLPDEAGTVITTAGVPASALPAGSVLQVVSTTKTDVFTETIGAESIGSKVTGLSPNITPSSSSSKVLILGTIHGFDTANAFGVRLIRTVGGSDTEISLGDGSGSRQRVTSSSSDVNTETGPDHITLNFLDAPATTSEVTYSIKIFNFSGASRLCGINRSEDDLDDGLYSRQSSTLTVMEIAG